MGLFDNAMGALSGFLGQEAGGENSSNIVGSLLSSATAGGEGGGAGGLGGILTTLAENGLGDQVASWVGDGHNLPITPEQLHDALGSEQVQQLAQSSGLPVGDFLKHLADHLPSAAAAQPDAAPADQG